MRTMSGVSVLSASVLFALFMISTVSATPMGFDPIKDFCRRFYHQSAVIGNRLYIDGGYITSVFNPNQNFTNDRLLFHNLDEDTDGITPLVANLTKPSTVPSVIGGALWSDDVNDMLYLYNGEFPDGVPSNDSGTVWAYDPWADSWSEIGSHSNDPLRASFGASAVVESMGIGYYFGGWESQKSTSDHTGPKTARNTIVEFDMVSRILQITPGPQRQPRVEGVLLYLDAGDGGLLVSFGGMYAIDGNENNLVPASMMEIDVFDVSQRTWYSVNATGDDSLKNKVDNSTVGPGGFPAPRKLFCGGIGSALDGSSHNAYIYGGAGTGPGAPGSDDVWILSMPSFKWILYWNHQTANIHNGFSCNVVRQEQMIVIGGTFPQKPTFCDVSDTQGSHYLDLGRTNNLTSQWYGYRKNLTTYSVPKDVYSKIGGGPTGGATVKEPDGGFNGTSIAALFRHTPIIQARQPTRTPKAQLPPPPPPSNKNLSKTLGLSLGLGLPVVIAIALITIYIRKCSRKPKYDQFQHPSQVPDRVYQLPTTQSPMTTPTDHPTDHPAEYPLHHQINNSTYPFQDTKIEEPQELPTTRASALSTDTVVSPLTPTPPDRLITDHGVAIESLSTDPEFR